MEFIAGRMTATYGGSAIGQISDGFTIEHTVTKRLITGDVMGPDTPQDAVYLGMNVFVEFTLMEYNGAATGSIIWPYDATFGETTTVGTLDVASSLTAILVLSDVAGTTATNTPNSLTAHRAIIAAGFPVDLLFSPDLREIPIRMQLYPEVLAGPTRTEFFAID